MTAQEAHIIDQRVSTRLPEYGDGPRIDAANKDSKTADDVRAAHRRRDHGFGCAHALIAGRGVEQNRTESE